MIDADAILEEKGIDQSKYPMTFEEFDKRVRELLVEGFSEESKEDTLLGLKILLEEDPEFILYLYTSQCGRMDRTGKNHFHDDTLRSQPVSTLEMLC